MHNILVGRVSQGENVVYQGAVRICESPGSRRVSEWTAGIVLPSSSGRLHGIFNLELDDGRAATMFCTAADPRSPTGTELKFQGAGPLQPPFPQRT